MGEPTRKRRTDLGVRWVPPFRSRGTDVLETPCDSESAHSSSAKHVDDSGHANGQQNRGKHYKEIVEYHSDYSDSSTPSCLG